MTRLRTCCRTMLAQLAILTLPGASVAVAQSLSGDALVAALRGGGYVLVVRNGSALAERPQPQNAAPANRHAERELSDRGQGEMSVLGYAVRTLGIPIAQTLTSPAFHSQQSANYFGFGERVALPTLAQGADAGWLAARAGEPPPAGSNTVIVTHGDLIAAAFGRDACGLANAEALIFQPREGRADLVARLTLEDWAELAVD